MENDCEEKIHISENITNEYTDRKKYISNDDIIQNFIDERIRIEAISNKQLLKLKYILGINICLKFFPINFKGDPQGLSINIYMK